MDPIRTAFLTGLAAAGAASLARGQDTIFTLEGESAGDMLGLFHSCMAVPDADGDCVRDLLVGESGFDGVAGGDCGKVLLLSGATRAPIRTWEGAVAADAFGRQIVNVLDLDGDGIDDFGVGAPAFNAAADHGKVYVYSGATGAKLHEWAGENAGDRFYTLRGVGDATGDGVNDVLVGAYNHPYSVTGTSDGKLYLYSGADGSLFNSWVGATDAVLGWRIARLGFDVDGDGADDFAATAPDLAAPSLGHLYVYSGKSQTPLITLCGIRSGDMLSTTEDAADVDADGIPDLLVGTPFANGGTGLLHLYSGRDWSLLHTWTGTAEMPAGDYSIAMAGDVDGDGHGDLLLGSTSYAGGTGPDSGILQLVSGASYRVLTQWEGEQAGSRFSLPPSDAGDLDGDGIRDQLVAAAQLDGAAGADSGKVHALRGNDLYLNVDPAVATGGDTVTLTTTAGVPGNLVIDVITAIDGAPMFVLVGPVQTFDGFGELMLSGVVPTGLGSLDVELRSFAIGRSGKLIDSSARTLALQ